MKKWLKLGMVAALCIGVLGGCNQGENKEGSEPKEAQQPEQQTVVRVGTLSGPTGMGMTKLIVDSQAMGEQSPYQISIFSGVDEIVPKMAKGEVDIFTVPANMASILYQKTKGNVSVLAINTLGVLNIMEKGESIHQVADLKGKTIYSAGKGATPEYMLNYLLLSNGLTPGKDVTIEYKSEQEEVVAALSSSQGGVAVLPQPFATVAQIKDPSIKVALDVTEQWNQLETTKKNGSSPVTGVVIANREFLEKHPELVEGFLASYKASIEYVNSHVDESAQMMDSINLLKAPVAKKAIPLCNIVYIDGQEMKTRLSGYLQVLFEQNPESIGGKLPDESFYYLGEKTK